MTTWINPEIKRPKDGSKIIVTCSLGLFWGIFTTEGNGLVYIEGKRNDRAFWEDIGEWIYYPKDFN